MYFFLIFVMPENTLDFCNEHTLSFYMDGKRVRDYVKLVKMREICPESCPMAKRPYAGFYIKEAYAHQPFVIGSDDAHRLVFVISGSCRINSEECINYTVGEKQMFLCYNRGHYQIEPLSDLKLVVAHFSTLSGAMCDIGAVAQSVKSQEGYRYVFRALSIKKQMQDMLDMLMGFLDQNIMCASMHESMLGVMFVVLKFFYSREEMVNMFYNLYDAQQSFCTMVEGNRAKAKNLNHLAQMCGYDINTFNVVFRRYYPGVTPGAWIRESRKDDILRDLTQTNAPVKFIANKYGFASSSHLGEFCKRFLGGTPTAVRAKYSVQKKE